MTEFNVIIAGKTFLVDVQGTQVDVYATTLAGASSSLVGEALLVNGKLTKCHSRVLHKPAWQTIEQALLSG